MLTVKEKKRKSIKKLGSKKINQQTQNKKKRLAKLLANKKAINSLLEYLKSIEVGGRKK